MKNQKKKTTKSQVKINKPKPVTITGQIGRGVGCFIPRVIPSSITSQ